MSREARRIASRILTGTELGCCMNTCTPHSETRRPLMAVLRSAMSHEESNSLLREFLRSQVDEPLAAELGVPDQKLRVDLATSHLIGLAVLRYVLQVEPLASADPEAVIGWIAPALDRYLAPRTRKEVPS